MLDTGALHHLPWKLDNNPNGWIEPTTECQLKCPFCYRGADQDGFVGVHTPVEVVKRDIDALVEQRKVATISIAGGEPLMYPNLLEIVDYIRERDVEVMILTNGILLDEAMLRNLKAHSVARVMVHIDKHQGRAGITTEAEANRLREKFCKLFRKVGGISLGFIQPLGPDDLDDLDDLIPFFKANADVVDLITFNRLQPIATDGLSEDYIFEGRTLYERVRSTYGLEWGAYLRKTHSEDVSWLFGQAVFAGTECRGSLDREAFKFFQDEHYKKTGQYLHCARERHMGPKVWAYVPFNRSLRRIVTKYLVRKDRKAKLNHQLILIVNTPTRLADGDYDRCEGCPDAMFYDGKLVPSCLLEIVKEKGIIEAR